MSQKWVRTIPHGPGHTLDTLNHGFGPLFCCFITVFGAGGSLEIMTPNHGLRYPKCVLAQKGWNLLISEAFGAIWVHYNSGIKWKRQFVKKQVSRKKRLPVYAGETMQLLDGFVFFLSLIYVGLLRKNAKNDNYLVKFGCVNG